MIELDKSFFLFTINTTPTGLPKDIYIFSRPKNLLEAWLLWIHFEIWGHYYMYHI